MYRRAVERGWGGLAESKRVERTTTTADRTAVDRTAVESDARRAPIASQP